MPASRTDVVGEQAAAAGARAGADRPDPPRARPRLGFLGVGWIGRHRLDALVRAGVADVAAVADPAPDALAAAADVAPDAEPFPSLASLLDRPLDGVVIATPSALHAAQASAALERGMAVFCQKPLARTGAETRQVLAAARAADRLLGVDLCYRRTAAMQAVRRVVRDGTLGRVLAVDLTFHNAYGPDGAWFRDPSRSGGGCVMDLGIHLVDLALWTLGFPAVDTVSARLYHRGTLLGRAPDVAEDHGLATLGLAGGATVRIACSWDLHAGRDAVIEAAFYGTDAGAVMRNVDGSFFDFTADLLRGTASERLVSPPDDWGGRTLVAWAERLARSPAYDPAIETATAVADVLDRVYGR